MMKQILALFLFLSFGLVTVAQKIDSIYFHLYTDSLKKGTHNYINVDGKLSNGQWKPLSEKEITFATTYGSFENNNLVLPDICSVEKLTIKATLKSEPWISKEITVWIKKKPDDEILLTKDEILNRPRPKQKTKN